MGKEKKISLVILIILGVLALTFLVFQKKPQVSRTPILPSRPTPPEEVSSKKPPSFSGKVEEKGNDFIIVSKGKDEKIKVILDPQTQVFKIIYPKEAGQKFTTKRVQISPDEIKKGDTIFVKTTQKGKVISHVEYIEVL